MDEAMTSMDEDPPRMGYIIYTWTAFRIVVAFTPRVIFTSIVRPIAVFHLLLAILLA